MHKWPFLISLATANNIPGSKVNIIKIMEALIISAVVAGFTTYTTTKVLTEKMEQIEARRVEDRQQAQKDREEMKYELRHLQDMVEDHLYDVVKRRVGGK